MGSTYPDAADPAMCFLQRLHPLVEPTREHMLGFVEVEDFFLAIGVAKAARHSVCVLTDDPLEKRHCSIHGCLQEAEYRACQTDPLRLY